MIEILMTRYIIALIYRDTRANCVELAECFEGLSHDPFSRMPGEVCCWPTRLWQGFARRLSGEGGYLLLDDTVRNGGKPCLGSPWGLFFTIGQGGARDQRGTAPSGPMGSGRF
ncbi:MAG: hypothetical protein NZ823_10230 [Blastocatellia bacterium]|nr:hypothetical protein [Blastocatellia bacterium]